jgi:hypothetical protein
MLVHSGALAHFARSYQPQISTALAARCSFNAHAEVAHDKRCVIHRCVSSPLKRQCVHAECTRQACGRVHITGLATYTAILYSGGDTGAEQAV